MKILLLVDRVAEPIELRRSSVDSDWVRALSDAHEVLVSVDTDGRGASTLRDSGIAVHVSDKRALFMPGGGLLTADEVLASWVAQHHATGAIDLVVASADRARSGPVAASLPDVPWGALLGAASDGHARRLSFDQRFLSQRGHELWTAASVAAAADVVLSPVPPAALGLELGDTAVARLLPDPALAAVPMVSGPLVVVSALGAGVADGPSLVQDACTAIEMQDDTNVIVLVGAALDGFTPVAPAAADGVPDGLRDRVCVVAADTMAESGSWLEVADSLVLFDDGERLVPAIRRAASTRPTAVLHRRTHAPDPVVLTKPPVRREVTAELMPWPGLDLKAQLQRLATTTAADVVVLHTAEATTTAASWLSDPTLAGFDVVVGARSRPPWGAPNLQQVLTSPIALHRRTWSAVAMAAGEVRTSEDLLSLLLDLGGIRSHRLGVIASTDDRRVVRPKGGSSTGGLLLTCGPVPMARVPAIAAAPAKPRPAPAKKPKPPAAKAPAKPPAAKAPAKPSPAPTTSVATPAPAVAAKAPEAPLTPEAAATAVRGWAHHARWGQRASLARPWQAGLGETLRSDGLPDEVVAWVRSHRMADRIRLLAPIRFGMLKRTMKDRW